MAVQLDLDAVRDAVEPPVLRAADALLANGQVGEITAVGGGATATVDRTPVWVGIVNGDFTAECDCADTLLPGADSAPADNGGDSAADSGGEELCAHAIALTIAAIEDGFAWSSAASLPSHAVVDPAVRRLTEIAATLPRRKLAALVGEHAATDRKLETRLMTYAGKLGAPSGPELAAVRETIHNIAAEATDGRWGLEDLSRAGRLIVDELEVLALRPPNAEALAVVEDAARQWDELSVHLQGGYYNRELTEDPETIGDALLAVHVRMCEQLDVDPDELADRLIDIVSAAEISSCLAAPDEYLTILGPDRAATLPRRY